MKRLAIISSFSAMVMLTGCGESVEEHNANVQAAEAMGNSTTYDASADSMTVTDPGLPGDGAMAMQNRTEAANAQANADPSTPTENSNAPAPRIP